MNTNKEVTLEFLSPHEFLGFKRLAASNPVKYGKQGKQGWILPISKKSKDAFFFSLRAYGGKVVEPSEAPLPADYEACGQCGFDHAYEHQEAHAWHTKNPE